MVNSLRILRVIVYRVGQAPFSNIPMTILTQRRRLLCSLFAGFCLPLESQSAQLDYAERDEVRLWAAQFSERYQIDFSWTLNTLHQARYLEVAHKIMSRPKLTATSTPKNWLAHRNMFLTAERIQSGVAFYRENAEALSLAYAKWHVPAENYYCSYWHRNNLWQENGALPRHRCIVYALIRLYAKSSIF